MKVNVQQYWIKFTYLLFENWFYKISIFPKINIFKAFTLVANAEPIWLHIYMRRQYVNLLSIYESRTFKLRLFWKGLSVDELLSICQFLWLSWIFHGFFMNFQWFNDFNKNFHWFLRFFDTKPTICSSLLSNWKFLFVEFLKALPKILM